MSTKDGKSHSNRSVFVECTRFSLWGSRELHRTILSQSDSHRRGTSELLSPRRPCALARARSLRCFDQKPLDAGLALQRSAFDGGLDILDWRLSHGPNDGSGLTAITEPHQGADQNTSNCESKVVFSSHLAHGMASYSKHWAGVRLTTSYTSAWIQKSLM